MSSTNTRRSRKLVIVGAGPVGCLAALSFAKNGWAVELYEGRPDMRLPSSKAASARRSVNLAISSRGIAALQAVDQAMTLRFLDTVIPMKGRMIHDSRGNTESQLYDTNGQCINSIDRGLLNEGLLNEVLAVPGLRVHFLHKLVQADFDKRVLTFSKEDGSTEAITFDLCIGADGSYSNVRRQLMRFVRMDYQQTYISHEYIELRMPCGPSRSDGKPTFLLDPNHLHIWPRHSFMLIALPNKDRTFTCTLFAPTSEFESLRTNDDILSWFGKYFPDALALIGGATLLDDFARNPRSPLISLKARPYHYKDRVVILGDAAHSMVPFYGQGLNCGLEDVRVLGTILRDHNVDPFTEADEIAMIDDKLASALREYSATRHDDLVAICDLAMDNYVEMRHSVTTPIYRLLKRIDSLLSYFSPYVPLSAVAPVLSTTTFSPQPPKGWLALYTMVTFRPDIRYSIAKAKAESQFRLLKSLGLLASGGAGLLVAAVVAGTIRSYGGGSAVVRRFVEFR